MKLLFVHSGARIKEDVEGNLYIDGAYSKEIFQRYLDLSNELTVILKKDPKIYDKEYATKNFEIFNSKKIKFVEYEDRNKKIKDFINIKKLLKNKKIVKEQVKKCDKLIVRLPCSAGYEATKYAKKYKKKCMVECVGCIWDALWNYGYKGKILAPFNYLRMRNAIRNAEYVIYVTEKFLQKRYPNRLKSLGCSDVSINEVSDDILNKRKEKIENMNDKKNISIATVAAIDVKYKGQKYVLKAIKILKEKYGYNIKYFLIGGGKKDFLYNKVKKYNLEDNVIFTGPLTHDEVFEYLDNIDIYIQPSRQEGLSRAVIEAMSRGCPTIVSDVGGNTELIQNKKFVFDKKVEELVECIINMDKDNMLQEAMVNFENAKRYIQSTLESKRKEFYNRFKNDM